MRTVWVDTETFSETPIRAGTYRYAETCEPMIVTYAIDDGPVRVVDLTLGLPEDWWMLSDLLNGQHFGDEPYRIVAHNAMFDRNVFGRNRIYPIRTEIENWRCCMVKALAHGLPGSLDKLCDILGIDQDKAKHKDGKALIQLFCKPRPKNSKLRRATRVTHPAEWRRFCEYAAADILAMREVWNRLPSWNYGEDKVGREELALWHLDQKINDRGVRVDLALVDAAIRATDREQARLRSQVREATDGYVTAATQRDRMLEFILAEHGLGLADLTSATVTKMLDREDLDPDVRELLTIRDQASQSSTSKYQAFRRGTSADGRLRGMLQFDGAARTRRDAGRTVQLQNLPSRGLLPHDQIEIGVEALLADCEDMLFDNVMLLTASTIRSAIVPPSGKKLVVADLANIEGRGLAWLAGEEWKLQAFRDFDTIVGYDMFSGEPIRLGPDLYKLAYAKSFNIPPGEVTKFGRSIGKVQELGLGYQGGINAFVTFALVYGINLEEMADTAWPTLPRGLLEEAESFVDWLESRGSRWPMSRKAATVCECFKRMWREAHPMTVQLWAELEAGFRKACGSPGETFEYRGFRFRRDGAWLRIKLPSGRFLCYPQPQVAADGQLSYMGVNQFTRKWERIKTYGGRITENCCQSVARDFLFDALPGVEAAGYETIIRVHDELVTEAPDTDEFNPEHLSALLATVPPWGDGMPLAAAGFQAYRYGKD